jgi:molybdopterin-binding protein
VGSIRKHALEYHVKTQTADSSGSCRNSRYQLSHHKQWIYKGKVRTVKTPGGHHRIPEEDIQKYLQATLGHGSRDKWRVGSNKISESNQLVGRILELKVDGLVAHVTISIGDYRLTSIITADAASDLCLKIGDDVVALLKSSQVMILRNQI